jgi:hypothetical protein
LKHQLEDFSFVFSEEILHEANDVFIHLGAILGIYVLGERSLFLSRDILIRMNLGVLVATTNTYTTMTL